MTIDEIWDLNKAPIYARNNDPAFRIRLRKHSDLNPVK